VLIIKRYIPPDLFQRISAIRIFMIRFNFKSSLIIYLLFIPGPLLSDANGQDNSVRKEMLPEQLTFLRSLSDSMLSINENLINGKLYTLVADKSNHPFFLENLWLPGKAYFSGISSEIKIAKYDLLTDNLIILVQIQGSSFPVSINREAVNEFIISGHRFIFLGGNNEKMSQKMVAGYYEELYNGKTGLYARWSKTKAINKFTLQAEYQLKAGFFIKKENQFLQVKNNKEFRNALKDHAEEIKSFMKTNHIRFSPARAKYAGRVLEYYDNL
jgi:hypothetical protein